MGIFDFLKKKKPTKENTQHPITGRRSTDVTNNSPVSVEIKASVPSEADFNDFRNQKISEAKQNARNSIPSKNGLRPHEIAMLSKASNYKTSGNNFPQYWLYEYGIDDPQKVLDMLASRGFIKEASPSESLTKLKVSELKAILSEYNLPVKGKKADLIVEIQANISDDLLCGKIPFRNFALTQLGEQELKENEYVTYFGYSGKHGLTVWEMNRMIQGYPVKLYRDIIWREFNRRKQLAMDKLSESDDIYSYYQESVFINYEMCDFLIEENKHLESAINLWATAFYYDLLVLSVGTFAFQLRVKSLEAEPRMKRIKDKETGQSILVEDRSPPSFKECLMPEYKVKNLKLIKENLGYSEDELQGVLMECFDSLSVDYSRIRTWNVKKLSLSKMEIANLAISEAIGAPECADYIYRKIESEIEGSRL